MRTPANHETMRCNARVAGVMYLLFMVIYMGGLTLGSTFPSETFAAFGIFASVSVTVVASTKLISPELLSGMCGGHQCSSPKSRPVSG